MLSIISQRKIRAREYQSGWVYKGRSGQGGSCFLEKVTRNLRLFCSESFPHSCLQESTLCLLHWTAWLFQGFTKPQVLLLLSICLVRLQPLSISLLPKPAGGSSSFSAQVAAHKYLLIVWIKWEELPNKRGNNVACDLCSLPKLSVNS